MDDPTVKPDPSPQVARLFVAVSLAEDLAASVRRQLTPLQRAFPDVRWVPADNLHFTLKFLGKTPIGRVPEICGGLRQAARSHGAFDLEIGSVGAFPNLRHPSILWLDVTRGANFLSQLAGEVDSQLTNVGIPNETKEFRAHLTVARVKTRRARSGWKSKADSLPPLTVSTMRVKAFSLYESQLDPAGARYRKLEEFRLGSPERPETGP